MQLFVRGGNAASRSVVLDVQQGDLIRDVLRKYEAKEGFPVDALRVIFQGKLLDHDKALNYYNIKHGDTLNAIVTNTKCFSATSITSLRVEKCRVIHPSIHLSRFLFPSGGNSSERVEHTIPESSVENRARLLEAYNAGCKTIVQIVGDDYGKPRIGVFDIKSQTTVYQAAKLLFGDLKLKLEGLCEYSTVVSILSEVEVGRAASVRNAQMALIMSVSPWEAKHLKALAELHDTTVTLGKRDRTIFEKDRAISEKDRIIDEERRTAQKLTNTIKEKDSTIQHHEAAIAEHRKTTKKLTNTNFEKDATIMKHKATIKERDAAIHSLQDENARLGQQNASLERDRLSGARLHQISAAELGCLVTNIDSEVTRLTQLRGAAEDQRAKTEVAERERESTCMACLEEPRAVVLPCGCKVYCGSCYERILAGGTDDADAEEDFEPEPTSKCPLCSKPF
ncbi:unnamed protein product [Vitrella brassicaformis CCMP3155]|uniref:RING-type domain-containing protein n=2 Tax=Vitrella brassicaformis TaxID=1169539 RepID=A0A0G4G4M0_VITBC|nr:unnamed protein product [Vitrella brassicaformis CCMP3155]|eukprot:CEM23329.1 unnamed protein product [Vitrella brassicaformis CCMP3155]